MTYDLRYAEKLDNERKRIFRLIIPGRPVPAVRMTQREAKLMRIKNINPKYQATHNRIKRYLDYKDQIGWIGKVNIKKPLEGDISVRIFLYFSGGKTGDWDNYGKAICDGLNKIAWVDDRQIKNASVFILKTSMEERAEVEITALEG